MIYLDQKKQAYGSLWRKGNSKWFQKQSQIYIWNILKCLSRLVEKVCVANCQWLRLRFSNNTWNKKLCCYVSSWSNTRIQRLQKRIKKIAKAWPKKIKTYLKLSVEKVEKWECFQVKCGGLKLKKVKGKFQNWPVSLFRKESEAFFTLFS